MILLTGGSGLLGTEIQKHLDCYAPSRQELDITKSFNVPRETELIVHCAAYTDVEKAEFDQEFCYEVNTEGTYQLAKLGIPMVYISTEYVFDGDRGNYRETDPINPINYYAKTKAWGEEACFETDFIIIRTLFKKRPWKYPVAFTDQYTSGDYVDVIAPIIVKVILAHEVYNDIIHVGTGRKSIYDLAIQSREVGDIKRDDVNVPLPYDTSLNLDKLKELYREH